MRSGAGTRSRRRPARRRAVSDAAGSARTSPRSALVAVRRPTQRRRARSRLAARARPARGAATGGAGRRHRDVLLGRVRARRRGRPERRVSRSRASRPCRSRLDLLAGSRGRPPTSGLSAGRPLTLDRPRRGDPDFCVARYATTASAKATRSSTVGGSRRHRARSPACGDTDAVLVRRPARLTRLFVGTRRRSSTAPRAATSTRLLAAGDRDAPER